MTTHYMDEAENCDRIGIMDHARLIALDTPRRAQGGDGRRCRPPAHGGQRGGGTAARATSIGVTAREEEGMLRFEVEHADTFVPRFLRNAPIDVQSVDIARPTLNDVFLRLTGRAIRDEGADRTSGCARRCAAAVGGC